MAPGTSGSCRRPCSTHSTCPMTATRVTRLLLPSALAVKREHRKERFLRHLDRADDLHALLAFLLLLEQLALAGHVAAVAFRQHVLALGLDGLPGDDARADG